VGSERKSQSRARRPKEMKELQPLDSGLNYYGNIHVDLIA